MDWGRFLTCRLVNLFQVDFEGTSIVLQVNERKNDCDWLRERGSSQFVMISFGGYDVLEFIASLSYIL